MTRTGADAERELRGLMDRGFTFPFNPQGLLADRPLRRSAVLILFGALDRTPAATAASESSGLPDELDVLLTRRATGMRHHAGEIAFPGGGAEGVDGGDPARTALREAAEETGLEPSGVEVLGSLQRVHIPVSNNLVTPVVGWWRLPSEVAADRTESVDVFRVPVAELLDPAARGTSVLRRGGMTYRGPAFRLHDRLGGHVVWGFTGILLSALFDELGWSVPWDPDREMPITL
ncbi:NUDIX hydrolase [Leucobacter tenebrionis]|uniref:NUDIX hydrolase n=1 Tax=Leucobacter tenebrionis TaxID=2873270 RepID=UPI001CA6A0D5|nr:CoA pyrophosphatase [Leucobacter tenebrionis]QZY53162.1 CoA pyrophosphatase [Leucobacter tenebrionis]